MSDEPSARSKASPALPAQDEYDAICAVLMHTERGRWFLEEYARRSRSTETQVLLTAIQRIESVVRAERDRQARQSFRSDLLEMAKAITRTRAEVEEIKPQAVCGPPGPEAAPASSQTDFSGIFATAERIRDITWAMRGHGFDPSTCQQLEQLAASILSASSLRDPTDRRASKLSEVLQYLEHRVDAMLASCSEGSARQEADREALKAAPAAADPPWSNWPACDREPRAPEAEMLALGAPPSMPLLAGPPARPECLAGPVQAVPLPAVVARPAADPPRQGGADDPLARLKAMSEIERIALFS